MITPPGRRHPMGTLNFRIRLTHLGIASALVIGMGGLLSNPIAAAPNRGDVWVDVPGNVGDPGHENDPHICGAVDLYGNGLEEGSGTFTIYAWPPTGSKDVAASGTWTYDQTAGDNQVIAGPIDLDPGHYKLTADQTGTKNKVFWVTCAAATPTPSPTIQPTGAAWPF